jgi:hypothetical protein
VYGRGSHKEAHYQTQTIKADDEVSQAGGTEIVHLWLSCRAGEGIFEAAAGAGENFYFSSEEGLKSFRRFEKIFVAVLIFWRCGRPRREEGAGKKEPTSEKTGWPTASGRRYHPVGDD